MRVDVLNASSARAFLAGRDSRVELANYEDVPAVLVALRDRREQSWPERDRLTRVLIELHRESQSQLWASILMVIHYPLLRRIRSGLVGGRLISDDLDQLVVCGFLATLKTLDMSAVRNVMMGLQQRTQRFIYESLAREFRYERRVLLCENVNVSNESESEIRTVRRERVNHANGINATENTTIDVVSLSCLLSRASRENTSITELREVLTQDDSLRAYCQRHGEDEKGYQRMKKQRQRGIMHLRSLAGQETGE
jgi:hypothetical protein